VVASQEAKVAALFSYYRSLLGCAPATSWDFDIDALYSGCPRVDGEALVGPFAAQEIEDAVRGMDRSSAPGPDGLGPSFYRAGWAVVWPTLQCAFDAFFTCSLDLVRINRAHVILLPKKEGMLFLGSFRPVTLQNCSVKSICKALTAWLQGQIGRIVDVD
jgi:hypothetical protein